MKGVFRLAGVLLLLCGLFVFGYSWRDIQRKKMPSTETLSALFGVEPSKPKVLPVRVFRDAFNHIKRDFYKGIDETKLKYAGLQGMMASLGDPHTMFMEPRLAREFKLETKAQFAGIGARLGPDPLGARVGIVFEDSPAMKAGLKASDLIVAVDGKSVAGMDTDAIVLKVRGPEGTRVTLSVVRDGQPSPIDITIRRAKIVTPTVMSKMLGSGIGYIQIAVFSEPTADQFDSAWSKLESQGLNGLVIDLRNNPGGLLESVRDILSNFLENKPVVTLKMRDGEEERTVTLVGRKRSYGYPIAVLVNEESASASEIMAGVLKDYKLATLVGEHTYGKASVQNVIPFRDGSSAKITIARYHLPSGTDIGRKVDEDGLFVSGGIQVDIEEKLRDSPAPVLGEPNSDNQLAQAIKAIEQRSGRKIVAVQADGSPRASVDAWPIA